MPIKHMMDDDFENPAEKIFFLCRHIDHIGKTTDNHDLMEVSAHIERHLNVLFPVGRDEPPEVEPSFFLENFEEYQRACYLVYLERGYDLESLPSTQSHRVRVGEHIRFIRLFREACRLACISIPAFTVQGLDFPSVGID